MKRIVLIPHAEMRRKQKGLTAIEIELAIEQPIYKRKRSDGRIEIVSVIRDRKIKVIYEEDENYLRVITIM